MPENVGTKAVCQTNRDWDYGAFTCKVICGIVDKGPNANPMPWHASIFEKRGRYYEFKCAGSIVNAFTLLSSAHCFWDEDANEQMEPHSFVVVAGKFNRDYNVFESGTQESRITHIDIPKEYIYQKDKADLAKIYLQKPLIFNANLKPVCISLQINENYSVRFKAELQNLNGDYTIFYITGYASQYRRICYRMGFIKE